MVEEGLNGSFGIQPSWNLSTCFPGDPGVLLEGINDSNQE